MIHHQRPLKSKELEAFKLTRDKGRARMRERQAKAEHDRMVRAYFEGRKSMSEDVTRQAVKGEFPT